MPEEAAAFYDLIALYHFALQDTIVEVFGMDCVDDEFFDCQLESCINGGSNVRNVDGTDIKGNLRRKGRGSLLTARKLKRRGLLHVAALHG